MSPKKTPALRPNRKLLAPLLCISIASALAAQDHAEKAADILSRPEMGLKQPESRALAVKSIQALERKSLAMARAKAKAQGVPMRRKTEDGQVTEIVGLDDEGHFLVLTTYNANAAVSTAADRLQSSPYLVDGAGIRVGVWDAGSVLQSHQEFNEGASSRVNVMDTVNIDGVQTPTPPDDHATHVGGTVAASGVSAGARGMAPAATVDSYNWTSDESEIISRAATAPGQFATNIYLSNHSYGYGYGWQRSNGKWTWSGGVTGTDQNAYDPDFGRYNSKSRNLDSIAYNAPYYLAFYAAGNEGNDGPNSGNTVRIGTADVSYDPAIHPPGDGDYRNGFETIGDHGIAKNVITVGAANDAVTSGQRDPAKSTLASFSSTGPADDGRIKPDLVGNGVGLTSTVDNNNTAYGGKSGTSMASPNVCGTASLLVAQYRDLFANSAMRSSTLKGLLIHTATDIGNPGPDYRYGWGLVDAKTAADLLADHKASPAKKRLTEDAVSSSATTKAYSFRWDGFSPIRATLCWTDPAGSTTGAHDSRTPTLKNDLNLKLIAPDGTEHFPFVMPFVGTWTTASMALPAITGINNTDNVEQVLVAAPGQNGNWQAVVSYSGALTNSEQEYGLLISGSSGLSENEIQVAYPNGGETIRYGSSRTITWSANITGNVRIDLFKGGSLHSVLSPNETNDSSFPWVVPSALPQGDDYTVRISSVDNPAFSDTSDAPFGIGPEPTLADALDAPGLTWVGGGDAMWFPQAAISHDGVDAAQSASITHYGTSSMEATVTGPGTMTFWWKVSSETNYDFLRFHLNNVEQTGSLGRISGDVDWEQKTVPIPAGSQTVKWSYTKDLSVNSNADAAWVDQVVYSPANAPEIAVQQPVGVDLADGGAGIGFGSVNVGDSSPLTFTVSNTGNVDLTGLAVTKAGGDSADFEIGALGTTTVAPGSSTSFTVTFSPGAAGPRSAAIQIASNDADESPFDISLTGTGIGPGTLAVSPEGGFSSSGAYGGPFLPASLQYTLSNPGSTAINWAATKTADWVSLDAAGGTLAPGATTEVTVSIGVGANALDAGSYGDLVTFTNSTDGGGNTSRPVGLAVSPIAASLVLGDLNQTYDGSPRQVSVTTSPPGLAYALAYGGSSTAPSDAGTYAVSASITEPNFTGSASASLVVAKASQTITFAPFDAPVGDDAAPFALVGLASSGLNISYSSSNPGVATVSGGMLAVAGPGTAVITALQPGDANHEAATPVARTLTVYQANLADAVIHEPFDDMDASLAGNAAGRGLSGTWQGSGVVGAGSLAYGNLPEGTGGTVSVSNQNGYVSVGTTLAAPGLLDDGKSLWFSVLVRTGGDIATNGDFGFALGTDHLNSGNNVPIANNGQALGFTFKNNQLRASHWVPNLVRSSDNTGNSASPDSMYLVVGEIIWGASSETVRIYLPTANLTKGDAVSAYTTAANLEQTLFDTLSFGSKSANPAHLIDEIRVGASYEAVVGLGASGPGPVDRFGISEIVTPQTVGEPIAGITVTALDASGATATGFSGTVTFGGTGGFSGTSASFTDGILGNVSVIPMVAGSDLTLSVDDGAGHTGSTKIETIRTRYEAWSGNLAFEADSNGDGIDNGLAWALGANDPSAAANGILPSLDNTSDEEFLIFSYRRSDEANAAANIVAQYDSELDGGWTTAVHDGTNIIITPADDFYGVDPGIDKVEVKIRRSMAPDGRIFTRLKVTPSP